MCNGAHSTFQPINSKIYTDLQKLSKLLNTTHQRLLKSQGILKQHLEDAFDNRPDNTD